MTNRVKLDQYDYQQIDQVIQAYSNIQRFDIQAIADDCQLDQYTLYRLFQQWCGVSPKTFLTSLSSSALQIKLHEAVKRSDYSQVVIKTTHTPIRQAITWSMVTSPFGLMAAASVEQGLCYLQFVDHPDQALPLLEAAYPQVKLRQSDHPHFAVLNQWINQFDQVIDEPLMLYLHGTPFQTRVWTSLTNIAYSAVVSYQQQAARFFESTATRALASAVAANPIALIVPCHRVIRHNGSSHQYRWGAARKLAILGWEAVQSAETRSAETRSAQTRSGVIQATETLSEASSQSVKTTRSDVVRLFR